MRTQLLSKHDIRRNGVVAMLSEQARQALVHARPIKSGFRVGAAAIASAGQPGKFVVVSGWNVEQRNGDSIHAEENLAANLLAGERLLKIMAVGGDGSLLAACGSCRETLITHASGEGKILIRTTADQVKWTPVKDLLPERYWATKKLPPHPSSEPDYLLFRAALKLMQSNPYTPYLPQFESASVMTRAGNIVSATDVQDAAYHHDHALEIALRLADSNRQREITAVLVMRQPSKWKRPQFPCGRCRQKLFEAAQVSGQANLPVMTAHPSSRLWYSTPEALLPYSFGPKDLGIDVAKFI